MMFDLKTYKDAGARPRVHGNGFIQLDLDDRWRLHIWGDSRIPSQSVPSDIHDHVFGFDSFLLTGAITNIIWGVSEDADGSYEMLVPVIRQGEDTILSHTDRFCNAKVHRMDFMSRLTGNTHYRMEPFVFHSTVAHEPAATLIYKDGATQAQGAFRTPSVLIAKGLQPDNNFDRYAADPNLLWQIIEETLGGL